ncbi:hypothetical protein HYT58_02315 [Candidatus Woesearchaeota archaeon]|nr:hypothetical protein [Candidatus Woesearchaeota archaeon]
MKNLCIVLTDKGKERIKLEREKKFGSQMTASWEIGIPQINISRWERGAANPKFFKFRSYLQRLGIYEGFLKDAKYVSGTVYHGFKIKRIKSFKLTKESAYMLGVIGPGDGYISKYAIGLDAIDKDFVDYFQYCLEKTFGLKCKRYTVTKPPSNLIKTSSRQYRVMLFSKSAAESFKKYRIPFKEKIWRVPEIIKSANSSYKAAYLRGFFDSQGSVSIRAKFISAMTKNEKGMLDIQSLLGNSGIEASLHKDKFRMSIHSERCLRSYYSMIGFTISRKQKDLAMLLNNYKEHHNSPKEVIKRLPDMVQLRKTGLSYRKIASIVKISRGTVGRSLKWREL